MPRKKLTFLIMNQAQNPAKNRITVLVFKDQLAARTFQVPLRWLFHLGALAGFLVLFSMTMCIFAVRYYHLAQLADLNDSKPSSLPQSTLAGSEISKSKDQVCGVTPRASDQNETNTPQPATKNESLLNDHAERGPLLTHLFTALSMDNPPTPVAQNEGASIEIKNPRISWQDKTLNVRFALQYTKTDRGSQQGKIIVLARGPSTLLAYPKDTLNTAGSSALINYGNGEFFSVSRYREGQATFGPLQNKNIIRELELLILSKEGKLLLYQNFPLNGDSKTQSKPDEREES